MKKVLITGGSGMVGSNFIRYLSKNREYNLYSIYNSHQTNFDFCKNIQIDITKLEDVLSLRDKNLDIIIHCAAIAKIASCESNPDLAHKINVIGTQNIVEIAKITKAKLIYISTDAIFDGKKGNYNEKDKPSPLTVYGKTKLDGERYCLNNYNNTLVIRTNLFGKNNFIKESNFIESIVNNLKKGEEYRAFYDVKFSPLFVDCLAEFIVELYNYNAKGIFHVAGSDSLTKYEFAELVAETFGFDKELIKRSSIDDIFNIKKVKDLTLNNTKLLRFLNKKNTPPIKEMVSEFKRDYQKNNMT